MATMEHYPVSEEGTGGTPLKLFVGQVCGVVWCVCVLSEMAREERQRERGRERERGCCARTFISLCVCTRRGCLEHGLLSVSPPTSLDRRPNRPCCCVLQSSFGRGAFETDVGVRAVSRGTASQMSQV